jgi:hypothetical protein
MPAAAAPSPQEVAEAAALDEETKAGAIAFLERLQLPAFNTLLVVDGWAKLFAKMGTNTADPLSVGRRLGELVVRDRTQLPLGVLNAFGDGSIWHRLMAEDGLAWKESYTEKVSLAMATVFEENGIPTGTAEPKPPEGEEKTDGTEQSGPEGADAGSEADPGRAADGGDLSSDSGDAGPKGGNGVSHEKASASSGKGKGKPRKARGKGKAKGPGEEKGQEVA